MLDFGGGGVVSGSNQREPSTTKSACARDSGGHGGVVGGGSEREPTTAENEHARSIFGVMGVAKEAYHHRKRSIRRWWGG